MKQSTHGLESPGYVGIRLFTYCAASGAQSLKSSAGRCSEAFRKAVCSRKYVNVAVRQKLRVYVLINGINAFRLVIRSRSFDDGRSSSNEKHHLT